MNKCPKFSLKELTHTQSQSKLRILSDIAYMSGVFQRGSTGGGWGEGAKSARKNPRKI